MENLTMNLLAVTPLEGDVLMSFMFLSLGLTLIGLFSKYRIFLLIAIAPIMHLMYHMSNETHSGYQFFTTAMAGWILFNTYIAFMVEKND